MKCAACKGRGIHPGYSSKICEVCKGIGELSDERINNSECRPCKGTGIHPGYSTKICEVCGGWGLTKNNQNESYLQSNGLSVFFVESGKPRTAHLDIRELLKNLNGTVRICDPYYGTASLYRLDLLKQCKEILFLTSKPDSKEKEFISKAISEFKKEHGSFLFKKTNSKTLHDRFILSDSEIILLGHGLKDIGNKESFVVRLPKSLAGDIIDQVKISFDEKWKVANELE